MFSTDGEYTAFASVALGQFDEIEDHLRGLRDVSLKLNGTSGKVVHEVVNDGTVFFGALADPGNTDETAKFPSAVALVWRWTGDDAFLREMYAFTRANMHFIVEQLDADGDGWPEGLGNVERTGMGEEKLDNTVYTIRGLTDLADMAAARGDRATERWAQRHARDLERRFEAAWWLRERARLRRLARRPRQQPALPAVLDRRDADGGRAHRRRRPGRAAASRATTAPCARSRCTSSRATATTSASTTPARPAATARRSPTRTRSRRSR